MFEVVDVLLHIMKGPSKPGDYYARMSVGVKIKDLHSELTINLHLSNSVN